MHKRKMCMKEEIKVRDFDVTTFSSVELFQLLENELKVAFESVASSKYWGHIMILKEKDCAVKNLKLEDGEVYPCRKLSVEWRELSGTYGNLVEVIVSPFGAKFRDVCQNIVLKKDLLDEKIKKIMMDKFPNSSYLEECEKLKNKDCLSR